MRRMTVIETPEHRMGGDIYYREDKYRHDPELMEAYHCGVKHGWKEAMETVERGEYHERQHYSRGSLPPMYRDEHPMHHEPPMYREDWRMPEHDEVVYRRGRDSRGRYV